MNITPRAIDFAIHRLLTGRQVTLGCSFPLKELMQIWPETLLRRGDLIQGLESLRHAGHLTIDQTAEGPMVRLMSEEFGLIRTREDREAIATLNRLREVRRRPQSHMVGLIGGLQFTRRPGDAPAAAG